MKQKKKNWKGENESKKGFEEKLKAAKKNCYRKSGKICSIYTRKQFPSKSAKRALKIAIELHITLASRKDMFTAKKGISMPTTVYI